MRDESTQSQGHAVTIVAMTTAKCHSHTFSFMRTHTHTHTNTHRSGPSPRSYSTPRHLRPCALSSSEETLIRETDRQGQRRSQRPNQRQEAEALQPLCSCVCVCVVCVHAFVRSCARANVHACVNVKDLLNLFIRSHFNVLLKYCVHTASLQL